MQGEADARVARHALGSQAFAYHALKRRAQIASSAKNRVAVSRSGDSPKLLDWRGGRRAVNARPETAAKSGMFRGALSQRRCIVPADAFYEWKAVECGKQPYAIARQDGQPMAFASPWENFPLGNSRDQRWPGVRPVRKGSRIQAAALKDHTVAGSWSTTPTWAAPALDPEKQTYRGQVGATQMAGPADRPAGQERWNILQTLVATAETDAEIALYGCQGSCPGGGALGLNRHIAFDEGNDIAAPCARGFLSTGGSGFQARTTP